MPETTKMHNHSLSNRDSPCRSGGVDDVCKPASARYLTFSNIVVPKIPKHRTIYRSKQIKGMFIEVILFCEYINIVFVCLIYSQIVCQSRIIVRRESFVFVYVANKTSTMANATQRCRPYMPCFVANKSNNKNKYTY